MRNLWTHVLIGTLLPLMTGAAPPKPEESEYLKTTGGGFLLEEGKPVYAMNFQITKQLPRNAELRFNFENPKKGAPDISETKNLEVSETEISVQSLPLECIRNNKVYLVTIEIRADSAESELLSTHQQKIEFRMPKQIVNQMGIPIC